MKKRVALIAPFGPQTGGMVELAKVLASMFEEAGYSVRKVNKSTVGRGVFRAMAIYPGILLAALSSDVLVLISSSGKSLWALDLPAVISGRALGKKVVIDFVGGAAMEEASSWGAFKRAALRLSSLVVVPTKKMMEAMRRQGVEASYSVIPHTVDVGIFLEVPRKEETARKVVLSAKNMESYANVGQIIRCVAEASKYLPEIELWIGGSGPEEQELRGVAAELLPGKAVFLGSVPHEKMPSVLAQADLLAHATRYESFGILLVEAMAAGVPVLSFDVGGISDVVENGVTGVLVPYGDSATMTEKLVQLLNDAGARRAMGRRGRETSARYSKSSIMKLWDRLLDPNGEEG